MKMKALTESKTITPSRQSISMTRSISNSDPRDFMVDTTIERKTQHQIPISTNPPLWYKKSHLEVLQSGKGHVPSPLNIRRAEMSDDGEDVLDERDTNTGANVFVKYDEFA